jgi:hypothetical protein
MKRHMGLVSLSEERSKGLPISRFILWSLCLLVPAALSGACDGCGGDDEVPTEVTSGASSQQEIASQPMAQRLTPEQVSNRISAAFSYQLTHVDEEGYVYNDIIDEYGVSLGGVDFITAARRDPAVKVSTLLVAHAVAWTVAQEVVWADEEREASERQLFLLCDMEEDHPLLGDEEELDEEELAWREGADQRWRAQLDDIYWRALSRPPTSEEVQIMRGLFVSSLLGDDDWPPRAWTTLLYALMSTVEFWTV